MHPLLPLREKCAIPSRTSRWYACQYHRTCRSSLYPSVSCLTPQSFGEGGLTAGGGGLSGIDVADNDHVDVHLLLTAAIVSEVCQGWLWQPRALPVGKCRGSTGSRRKAGRVTYPMLAVLCCLRLCGGEGKLFDTQIYSARCKV